MFDDNIRGPDFASFLREVRRSRGRKLLVVWDRLSGHRSAQHMLSDLGGDVIFEHLPAYAPELNPVEMVWGHSKMSDLANHSPLNDAELVESVYDSLSTKKRKRTMLSNFFTHAGLPL